MPDSGPSFLLRPGNLSRSELSSALISGCLFCQCLSAFCHVSWALYFVLLGRAGVVLNYHITYTPLDTLQFNSMIRVWRQRHLKSTESSEVLSSRTCYSKCQETQKIKPTVHCTLNKTSSTMYYNPNILTPNTNPLVLYFSDILWMQYFSFN